MMNFAFWHMKHSAMVAAKSEIDMEEAKKVIQEQFSNSNRAVHKRRRQLGGVRCQKLDIILVSKVILKMMLSENVNNMCS